MGQPQILYYLFYSYQTHITIFTTKNVKKCPSSICAGSQTHDLWNMSLLPLPLNKGFLKPISLHKSICTQIHFRRVLNMKNVSSQTVVFLFFSFPSTYEFSFIWGWISTDNKKCWTEGNKKEKSHKGNEWKLVILDGKEWEIDSGKQIEIEKANSNRKSK